MKRIVMILAFLAHPVAVQAQVPAELDAYWAEVSRTVAEGDFDGYAALYHPDAVLVSLGGSTTYAIQQALAGWKQGFDDTKAGGLEAEVVFRITQRMHDDATAHDTGIFRYVSRTADGGESAAAVHFQALFVKKDGKWLMMMEYQMQPATDEEWAAAGMTP